MATFMALKYLALDDIKDPDFGNLAVVVDDGTLVTPGGGIDYIRAYQLFRITHPDVYDFIMFFSDTSSGMPFTGSFHSGIYNATSGINYYAGGSPGSPYNIRPAWVPPNCWRLTSYHQEHGVGLVACILFFKRSVICGMPLNDSNIIRRKLLITSIYF
jgi:hypothetical protein